MRRFRITNKDKVENYWRFKYRYLLNASLGLYYSQQRELEGTKKHTEYSELLFEEGDEEGALAALLSALEIAPDNPQCHNNLGVYYWRIGEQHKAVGHFADARGLDPNHRDTVWNCGQVMADANEYMMARYIYHRYMQENGYDREMVREINNL